MRNDHGSFRGLHRGLFYGNRGGDSGLGGNKGGGDNMDGGRSLDVIVDGGKSGVFACGGGGESSFESSLGGCNLGNIFKIDGISRSSIKGCLERSFSFGYF